ncbi:MAG: efflux RND transporter periplasmic adaptor subunit [Acidobacteriota bacterium]|nr:efflux RND transporter periplasmic adaptor subunit [Acidobacteriota bacterium]
MKNFRWAFFAVLGVNFVLVAALIYFFGFRRGMGPAQGGTSDPQSVIARPPAAAEADGANHAPPAPPLAPLQLSPQRLQTIGLKTGVAEYRNVRNEIRTTGSVSEDERLESVIELRFAGWIDKVFVNSIYQYVRKGEALFTIYSPDLVSSEQEYLVARENYQQLAHSTIPGVASGAASLLSASVSRLQQWGVPANEINRLEKSGRASQEITFYSPVSGYVTGRNALPHVYAQPGTRLYTITGLSPVWIYADLFQSDAGEVRVGDPATVTVDAYPGREFRGRVSFISPQVDAATRTVKVRLVFPNAGLKLMPGMFVNVALNIPLGRHLVIPVSGVLQTGTRNIVFVDHGGGYLEPRNVVLGPQAGDEFIVLSGLKAGERVVTSANFLIDSESQLQAALGSFAPPPPGAGAAAAMNAPASLATIEFTTSPSPPQKGADTFRARLIGPDERPIDGASVTVTLFMPAMPAMGMSALRTVVTLRGKGGGMYEGSGNLDSGGAWQVSITAQKGGQTIAARQLTVNATGGM